MHLQTGQGRVFKVVTVLLLCALFFIFAVGVTMLGSTVYSEAVQNSDENYTHRTALSYIVNQIWRSDVADGISIGTFGDGDALFLREMGYVTILYTYEGVIRELYTSDDVELTPDSGNAVIEVSALDFDTNGEGLLNIKVTTNDGEVLETSIAPKSGISEEVAR